jgi:hypothetical protein
VPSDASGFREDFQGKDPEYAKFNVVLHKGADGEMVLTRVPLTTVREDLQKIIEENK